MENIAVQQARVRAIQKRIKERREFMLKMAAAISAFILMLELSILQMVAKKADPYTCAHRGLPITIAAYVGGVGCLSLVILATTYFYMTRGDLEIFPQVIDEKYKSITLIVFGYVVTLCLYLTIILVFINSYACSASR